MNLNRSGLRLILWSLTVLLATSSGLAACSARQVNPVVVFDEDIVYKTQPNEVFPSKPYVMFHMSAKKLKEYTNR